MKWKAEDRDLVGAVKTSWHHAAVDRGLTRTMAKCQTQTKPPLH
jgi:hypothetical protein